MPRASGPAILPPADPSGRGTPARRLAVALLGAAAVVVLALLSGGPPAVVPADAPPDVGSGARALEVLERVAAGVGPHPVGTAENDVVRERLLVELRRVGLRPEVFETFAVFPRQGVAGRVRNVVARLPGAARAAGPRQAVLCLAHYDSVGAGPGISDDLAGCAALVEVARALRAPRARLARDVIFLFSDAEEHGLLGAAAFAAQHPWALEVGAVVNLEARGTRGVSRMFETGADNDWIAGAFAREATRPSTSSVSTEIYRRMPNDTDYTVFRERGVAGLNFAYIGGVSRYHTPLDDLAHLDPRSLQHQVTNALDSVRALDGAGLRGPGEGRGDAVFIDVLGRKVLAAREGTGRLAALAAAALFVFGLLRALRAGVVTVGGVLRGALLASVVGIAALVAGACATLLIELVGAAPRPWRAHPGPTVAAAVGAALAGAAGAAALAGRAVSGPALLYGGLLLAVCASLLAALFLTGGVYLVLPPTLLAAALTTVVRLTGDVEARAGRSAAWTGALAAFLWAPITAALLPVFGLTPPRAGGPPLGLALGVGVGAWAFFAAPVLARGWRSTGVMVAALGVMAVLFGAVMSRVLPATTPAAPGHLSVAYVLDADATQPGEATTDSALDPAPGDAGAAEEHRAPRAEWQLLTTGDPLPEAVTALADFGRRRLGTLYRWGVAAAAPAAPGLLPLPELEDLRWGGEDGRTVGAQLRSPAGGQQMTLELEGVELLRVEGVDVPADRITLLGTSSEGWRLELRLADEGAATVRVIDRVLGLPPALEFGRELAAARPADRVPRSHGDGAALARTFHLEPDRGDAPVDGADGGGEGAGEGPR